MGWKFIPILALTTTLAHSTLGAFPEDCDLPLQAGRCRARKPGYFHFNSETRRCEHFFYTGCGGNANQFRSLKDCHETCAPRMTASRAVDAHIKSPHCTLDPLLPPEDGRPAMACAGFFPKYTFDRDSLSCEKYVYGGCMGSQNLYDNLFECLSACVHGDTQFLPGGRGRGAGGAGGKLRGRLTKPSDEMIFPDSDSDSEVDVCDLPPISPGLIACAAFAEKYTFDPKQNKCVKYIYGGCRGTENLFDTQDACEARCPGKKVPASASGWNRPDKCLLPPVTPSPMACAAYAPMFTYSSEEGKCVPYVYGGCFGTENLFATEEECVEECDAPSMVEPRTVDVCALPVAVGNCRAMKPRFAFNNAKKRCEMFLYSGKIQLD